MMTPTVHTSGRRPRLLALLAVLVAGLVAGLVLVAPGAAHADGANPNGVPPGKAWVRVGHFVPGMGATSIDVQPLDGSGTAMSLAGSATYGQVTPYQKLTPGSYTVTVRRSGASSASAPMLSRSFEVDASQARTVAVLGTAAAPRLAVLSDDLNPPQAGTARIRLLSASDETSPVTVTAVGGPTIAQDAVQGQATEYATVPAGSWTLQLQAGSSSQTDATLQDVPVASGSVYTIVVLDSGDQQLKLDVVTDAAGAMKAPQGGAETGLGGMAPGRHAAAADTGAAHGRDLELVLLTLLGLLGLTAVTTSTAVVRRRSVRTGT